MEKEIGNLMEVSTENVSFKEDAIKNQETRIEEM